MTWSHGVWVHKLAPYMEGKERLKKEAATPDWSLAVFTIKRTHMQGLSWVQENRCLHLPSRILKVYIEALTGFSHIYLSDIGTTHCSLKAESLEELPLWELWAKVYILRTGEEVKSL